MTKATGSSELVERLRAEAVKNGGQGAYAWGARELCREAADRITDLEARLARAGEEVSENASKQVPKTIRERGDSYEIGQWLFNSLRAFLASAAVDANECNIIIEMPDRDAQRRLISKLQNDARGSIRSAARIGNHMGKWQGVSYEFGVKGWRDAASLAALRTGCPSCHGLNTSCPDGCGRDQKTGELNGTRLEAHKSEGLADDAVVRAVETAMRESWDDICSDTGCHPLDIYREGRKLFYKPNHWTREIAMHLRAAPRHNETSHVLLREARNILANSGAESGYCMCGDPVASHTIGSGHSPVDAHMYMAEKLIARIDAALKEAKDG